MIDSVMIDSIIKGVSVLFQPMIMLTMFLAVIVGLIFGILPGVSGMTFMALMIPFTLAWIPSWPLCFSYPGTLFPRRADPSRRF